MMKKKLTLFICLLGITLAQAGTVLKSTKRASADVAVLTSSSCWVEQETYDLVNGDRMNLHCFLRDYTNYGGPWDGGWACYDETGKTVWVTQTMDGYQLGYGFGWDDIESEIFYKGWEEMSNRFEVKDMADGPYILKPVSKLTGTTEWHNNLGTDACYLTAVKSGNTMTVTTTRLSTSLALIPSLKNVNNGIVEDDYVRIAVNVSNNGTVAYNDYVYAVIYKDRNDGTGYGDYAGEASAMISLPAGGSTETELTINKLEEDANYFIIAYYSKGGELTQGSSNYPGFTVKMKETKLILTPTVKYANNGVIGTKTATIGLHVTNDGNRDYDNQVVVVVYKDRNDGTGYGDYASENATSVNLSKGKSTDLELTIDGMENGANYFVIAYYMSKGELIPARETIPSYTVSYKAASLLITPTVVNADNEILESDKALLKFHVVNTGTTDYNDVVIANIFKLRDNGSGYGDPVANIKQFVSLAPGAETDIELNFDNVEDGASYFFWALYISNGEEEKGADYTPFFTFKYSTAIDAVHISKKNSSTAIYSLDGRQIKAATDNVDQTLRQLSKGIYIVGGKKIRN